MPKGNYAFISDTRENLVKSFMYIIKLSINLYKDFHSFDINSIKE